MNITPNLLVSFLSAVNPGFGIFASLVDYLVTDRKDAGKIFLFNLSCGIVAQDFISNFVLNSSEEWLPEKNIKEITNNIVPLYMISLQCEVCGKYSNRYVLKDGIRTCSKCLYESISVNIYDNILMMNQNLINYKLSAVSGKKIIGRNLTGYSI